MRTSMEVSPACIKPVKILSEVSAPPMGSTPVGLHYFEAGNCKHVVVNAMRPTYFEKVVVSTVLECLPPFEYPSAQFNTVRNLARSCFYGCKQMRASLSRPVDISKPVLDMRSVEPNNIAHLLTNVIPYYLVALNSVGPDLQILMRPVKRPFANLLNVFNIRPIFEDRRVNGEIVKVRGTRYLSVYDLLGTADCDGIHFAPDVYSKLEFPSALRLERIFLARRAPRSFDNQTEIEEVTNKYGYETIFMEDYPIREQLGLAAQAKHVIAAHGAAMSLLLMNRGMESIIEIFPSNVYHQLFPTCLGRQVRRYEQIVPNFDQQVAHSGWAAISYFKNRTCTVKASLLEKLLSEIH
jgi:hypothetical protein